MSLDLGARKSSKGTVGAQEVVISAAFDELAVFNDQDVIGLGQSLKPVCNEDAGRATCAGIVDDTSLCQRILVAGGFVENDNLR